MRPSEIEYQALQVLDGRAESEERVARFHRWPAPARTLARRLAGEANAARGLPLLWLLTGHTPSRRILSEFDSWIEELGGHFDGLPPTIRACPVEHDGRHWLAVQIETTRLPFVVRHGRNLEVPWKLDGTLRSASRSELMRLLVPAARLPVFELIEAELLFFKNIDPGTSRRAPFRWALDTTLFLVPNADDRVVINAPRCSVTPHFESGGPRTRSAEINFSADTRSSRVKVIDQALVADTVGSFFLQAYGVSGPGDLPVGRGASLVLEFAITGHEQNAVLKLPLQSVPTRENNQLGRWQL